MLIAIASFSYSYYSGEINDGKNELNFLLAHYTAIGKDTDEYEKMNDAEKTEYANEIGKIYGDFNESFNIDKVIENVSDLYTKIITIVFVIWLYKGILKNRRLQAIYEIIESRENDDSL